ncbi:hypothetical protein KY290_019485 [Solanum tuberosum]|uniref:Signal recognition particle subunit SRP72 n=1 Tax=Solanum tuberosum TaxID=4113 RepID=A0ABQ7VH53_SOLTU|nr:hypothetical protein KY290_019485 [Solanum tuberosum]
MDQARELVGALPGMFPGRLMPALLQAAVHMREDKAAKVEEILGQYADKFPDRSKVILLARAQERAGDSDGADAMFDSAIKWWSNAMTEDNKLNTIMQEAAAFKLRHGRKEEAARLYEQLVKSHGKAYEKQLKPLPGLKAIDVDSLEKTSGAKQAEKGPNAGATETYEGKSKDKTKKKRKRKPKYPKGFDPANPGLHLIQRGGFPRGRGLVTDQRERIREQLKLEVLKVQWLKRQRAVVIRSQTSQLIQKEHLRMQCNQRLHPNQGSNPTTDN